MRRRIILLVIIFLAFFPYIVNSASTFVITETEKLKVEPKTFDPDNDNLTVNYAPPLDGNGEWQTTYGDAGVYDSEISVSDGKTSVFENIEIIVKRKEEAPKIYIYAPEDTVYTAEGSIVFFNVSASDLNNDELIYVWHLDGEKAAEGQSFTYQIPYNGAGTHKVKIIVSDGLSNASREWEVVAKDTDIQKILDSIPDIEVDEGQIARLNLPDFKSYSLEYSISEPIGNGNEWQTNFDDEGSYNVKVAAGGNGFKGSIDVEVSVKNVDRAPVFEKIDNLVANENQPIKITLKVDDPDGDKVQYSAKNLPQGAAFEGNEFTWVPDFDTVKKGNFVDYMIDKLKALNKNFYVQFIAASNGKRVVSNVVITVKDANRAPILEDFIPINVNEGAAIKIVPNAYDLDGDAIKISYSGFMSGDAYTTNFNDAGAHEVKVTANDGSLETAKTVQIYVNNTNRVPIFEKIPERKAKEGEEIVILLDSYDPDGDSLKYSIENPPDGSTLNGNVFAWTPSYSTAGRNEIKKFDIVFAVGDGKLAAKQIAKIQVEDKNRAPKVINATNAVFADVNAPVFMFVDAEDPDGDSLSYVWDFGLLEKYKASGKHQRTFSTPGEKQVKVTISDGIEKVEQGISVFIRGYQTPVISGKPAASGTATGQNVPPKIVDASYYVTARVNQPVLLFVKAADYNKDPLKYTWDFGFLDKHEGTAYHQRIFKSRGTKTVKVTVSDGFYLVQQMITVNVV